MLPRELTRRLDQDEVMVDLTDLTPLVIAGLIGVLPWSLRTGMVSVTLPRC